MPQTFEHYEGTLSQRVAEYLRRENPVTKAFAAKEVVSAEIELEEYLLERAEAELREAKARVDEIRDRLSAVSIG